MPQPPAMKPLATPKPVSSETLGTLTRCAIRYAIKSETYLALALPEVFTDQMLANLSTETLTLAYQDLKAAIDHANRTHRQIGSPAHHLQWHAVAERIAGIVTARNQPSWKARPR